MKALVHGNRVCEIAAEEFPVAAPLAWVDCDGTVTTSHAYIDGVFRAPQPSRYHEWNGTAWEIPTENEKDAHNAGVDGEIVRVEAANPITHRASREGLYAQALLADMINEIIGTIEDQIRSIPGNENFTIQRLPDLKKNAGMVRIKAADDAIRVLRAQRLP